jgi:type IV pilus assembly protein PilW
MLKALSPKLATRDLDTRDVLQKIPRGQHSGFSLVEIMVGMVIGMLGIIVIMQVFALFEGQKRTTSGGAEAMNTGAIALSGLSDDIRQSGYGFIATNLIGCDVVLRTGVTLKAMAPVTINSASIPAGDANTDTLVIAYGNSETLPEGNNIVLPVRDTTDFDVQASTSFLQNDYVIATPSNRSCTPANPAILNKATQIGSLTPATLKLSSAVTTSVTPGMLFDLGQSPTIHVYAVREGSLTMCDYMVNDCGNIANVTPTLNPSVWVPIAGNIVSLRAQYGQDITNQVPSITSTNTGSMDGIVDIYSQTSPADTGAVADACGWLRTLGIRLALVARSSQYEKTAVTTTAGAIPSNYPVWDGSTATANSPTWLGNLTGASANPINVTVNPNGSAQIMMPDFTYNWQHYRYKVFQTTLPIRNVTTAVSIGILTGC